ncbi:YezD family protein [Oscillospiraceae bacterium HV4-5-C5C]|nr:YezD family protein [Oscillospiraceae bacterium HV4-5-C5C]
MSETADQISQAALNQLQQMARNIGYGTITLVFQDNRLVQIEKNEKIRIKKA